MDKPYLQLYFFLNYLLSFCIGIATVVDESRVVALVGCINEMLCNYVFHYVITYVLYVMNYNTKITWGQGHKVEMLRVFIWWFLGSFAELVVVEDFPNVLHKKCFTVNIWNLCKNMLYFKHVFPLTLEFRQWCVDLRLFWQSWTHQ